MSRLSLSPNYCSCTVHQARNLPDKGKNGAVDAFCTISMGKEKFVTAVREKTRTPEWQEQCDMAIVDDARIKLTVYHNTKNALSKGDFIGRAVISLRDLQDYDHIHRSWFKLTNKDGKNDKDRGEIDVSLQFYSKNNTTGSVLDLATKKKHLSLKDIKHSLGGKLKSASKHRKSEHFAAENQSTSFAGSQMSLNSTSHNNHAELSQRKSMSLNRREDDRMSSIRSSVKRKIQPKDDIMQQSFSEQLSSECQHRPTHLKYSTLPTEKKVQSRVLSFDDIDDIATPSIDIDTVNVLESPSQNKFGNGYTQNQSSFYNRTDKIGSSTLPDIVGEQSLKSSSKNPAKSSSSNNKKTNDNGLCVLGYENVKSVPVHPKVRQELDYLDREELLHVIAYQSDLLKKRDTRLKDLENYTDSLLVKILEQCPTILQVGVSSSTSSYRY